MIVDRDRIQAVLNSLEIRGISKGNRGAKVLLGDVILEEGKLVPQLIEEQVEDLRCTKITDRLIELTWADEEGHERPTRFFLELNKRRSPTSTPGGG